MKSNTTYEKMILINFKVPKKLYDKIKSDADSCNMDRSTYLRHILENNSASYYTGSVFLVNQACILSTEINKIKRKDPSVDFSKLEKGISELCAMLNS